MVKDIMNKKAISIDCNKIVLDAYNMYKDYKVRVKTRWWD